MKEFFTVIVLVGVVAYLLCQPTTVPQLERSQRERAAERPGTNNSAASATAAPADNSLTTRWQTGSNSASATPTPS